MGCGSECAEGHTHGPSCHVDRTSLRRGGHIAAGSPFTRVTTYRPTRCSNLGCPNRVGEGQFGIISIESISGRHKPVTLALCAPCIEALQEACRG